MDRSVSRSVRGEPVAVALIGRGSWRRFGFRETAALREGAPGDVFAEWKERIVAFDYHVDVDRHYYSVPHALVGHGVWARFTAATVEVFFRSERVART